ncbi:MAG: response regulator [Gemmatimonadaceae bacterium]
MKILLVDDDRVAREIVKRLLTRIVDSVVEADDGLQALEILEREDPDFVFTDTEMPVLVASTSMQAIRSSTRWANIPIVCLSDHRGREEFEHFRRLRVVDYILKPVRPQTAYDRFRAVVSAHAAWRQRHSASANRTLLLVDNDPNFRTFAKNLLLLDFEVIECQAGHEAARHYQRLEPKPDTVVMSNQLDLPSAALLAGLIQRLAADAKVPAPSMILTVDKAPSASTSGLFTGVVQRSFVPEEFLRGLRRHMFGLENPWERLSAHLAEDGLAWLETGTRQTLGVMAGCDGTRLDPVRGVPIAEGVAAQIRLDLTGGGTLHLQLSACDRDATRLAQAVLRRDELSPGAAGEVFAELINVIGGRARASLGEVGWDLVLGLPQPAEAAQTSSTTWDRVLWMTALDGAQFHLGLRLEPAADGLAFPESESASLSDVLF